MRTALVVLAAGIGRRFGGVKQMEPVGPSGEFILDYTVFDAVRAGFSKIVFVVRRDLLGAFRDAIGDRIGRAAEVQYVCQGWPETVPGNGKSCGRRKPWGTGHAVLAAGAAVQGAFAVVNADDHYGAQSVAVLARFLAETAGDSSRYAMVGFRLCNTLSAHGAVARGICRVHPDGTLAQVVEQTGIVKTGDRVLSEEERLTGHEPVSMNLWGFKPSVFDHLQREFEGFLARHGRDPETEFFLPDIVNRMIAEKRIRVSVLETADRWFGMTYPQDRQAVVDRIRDLVEQGAYPDRLWPAS